MSEIGSSNFSESDLSPKSGESVSESSKAEASYLNKPENEQPSALQGDGPGAKAIEEAPQQEQIQAEGVSNGDVDQGLSTEEQSSSNKEPIAGEMPQIEEPPSEIQDVSSSQSETPQGDIQDVSNPQDLSTGDEAISNPEQDLSASLQEEPSEQERPAPGIEESGKDDLQPLSTEQKADPEQPDGMSQESMEELGSTDIQVPESGEAIVTEASYEQQGAEYVQDSNSEQNQLDSHNFESEGAQFVSEPSLESEHLQPEVGEEKPEAVLATAQTEQGESQEAAPLRPEPAATQEKDNAQSSEREAVANPVTEAEGQNQPLETRTEASASEKGALNETEQQKLIEQYRQDGRNPSKQWSQQEIDAYWNSYPPVRGESEGIKEARNNGWPPAEEGYHWTSEGSDKPRLDRNAGYERGDNPAHEREYKEDLRVFVDRNDKIVYPADPDKARTIQWPVKNFSDSQQKELHRFVSEREKWKLEKARLEHSQSATKEMKGHAHANMVESSRQLGEHGAKYYAESQGFDERVYPLKEDWPSHSGEFDLIYKTQDASGEAKYVVIEAKGAGGTLGTRRVGENRELAEQGSSQYFDDIVHLMSNSKNNDIANLGEELYWARQEDRVEYLLVEVPIEKSKEGETIENAYITPFKGT